MTVRNALDQLERERRIYRIKGLGTFVAQPAITKTVVLSSFSEDIRRRGMIPSTTVLAAELSLPDEATAQLLKLDPTDPVVHFHRVRYADRTPICLEKVYLPARLVPDLLSEDLTTSSLYSILAQHYDLRPSRADQTIKSVLLTDEESALLHVPPHSAAFLVQRTTSDQRNRPIECGISLYRGDRYRYELEVSPSPTEAS